MLSLAHTLFHKYQPRLIILSCLTHASLLVPLTGQCKRNVLFHVLFQMRMFQGCYVNETTLRKIGIENAAHSQVNVAIKSEYIFVFLMFQLKM